MCVCVCVCVCVYVCVFYDLTCVRCTYVCLCCKENHAGRKPRFEDRDVDAHVYWNGLDGWQLFFSAEAVDVETGMSAKGEYYKSKEEAIKHARKNLEAVLLKCGIVDSDEVQGDIPTGRSIHVSSFHGIIYNNGS